MNLCCVPGYSQYRCFTFIQLFLMRSMTVEGLRRQLRFAGREQSYTKIPRALLYPNVSVGYIKRHYNRRLSVRNFSVTVLSMPTSNQGWPEEFGFKLGGTGPSYIITVEDGSSAHLSGLQPGDQVLEIEGQDVSSLGAQAVTALAQGQKNIPPSIGVVSRIQQVSRLHEKASASCITPHMN